MKNAALQKSVKGRAAAARRMVGFLQPQPMQVVAVKRGETS
jgi:hypothetical protein